MRGVVGGSGSRASLVRSAATLLRRGPVATLELAREVMGLSGHPGAASAAVYQLLGADPRFLVDPRGVWSLDPTLEPLGAPLEAVPFAVVDVETTGGQAWRGHRIIEIAVVEVRGGEVVDEYQTLVNPGRRLPRGITALTGIDEAALAGAPYFDHVAAEVYERLEGRVFVAHNATFDWEFISSELLSALGDTPRMPRLCTVRMVRRLVTALRHRNLDVVARHFAIEVRPRHRAYGDALATARVLLRLLDEARGRGIEDLATLDWYLKRRRQRRRRDPAQTSLALPGYGDRDRRGGR